MKYPEFFNNIETIILKDDLANFLGATEDGIIEFSYLDLVKSAGHSCPTVLGAYLMTKEGLKALYKDETPKRGEIKVQFKENIEEGVAGVIASVVTNITGATKNTGFKGIAGLYSRNNLMSFENDITSNMKLTRVDTNESVEVIYNPSAYPPKMQMQELMQKCIKKIANEEEISEFRKLWQERVELISKNTADVIKIV